MAIYRYQHGDRPLDGYTIQHGLGRGGFGEVYYAVSDSGREVALKSVQNYEDVELRGIKHCMNLKNAQLVSIFDIKHNEHGQPFVLMEYVDGPSLREILDSHPEGLGAAKAAFFLREMSKGLTYLHDNGVVHRDLKPHNVFYEQGIVKIGDYSLSKAISMSHRSGHTVTVGTVHYMAPEISMGRYDHTVDIYALGVMLYEMLVGHPPFLGQSMGEVLMQHVAGEVKLDAIEEPFRHVIAKAMAKEPEQRYQSVQAMVEDLFGHQALHDSVSALGPETLTIVAERAVKSGDPAPTTPPPGQPVPQATAAYVGSKPEKIADTATPKLRKVWRRIFIMAAVPAFVIAFAASTDVGHPGPVFLLFFLGAVLFGMLRFFEHVVLDSHKRTTPSASPVRPRVVVAEPVHQPVHRRHRRHRRQDRKAEHAGAAQPPRNPAGGSPVLASHTQTRPEHVDGLPPQFSSPYDRLLCLVLGGVYFLVPIAGLQRFYVGRVKSGLLWLFTFGFFGIGQIVDMVMIALGQFNDKDGRRVLDFTRQKDLQYLKQPVNQYSAVVRDKWTESRVGFKLGNLVVNLLGGIALLATLCAGAIIAVDIPRAMASGAFGKELSSDMYQAFGATDWNIIASSVLGIGIVITGTISAICLLFARRESNWAHLLRIPLATAAFVGAVCSLGTTTQFGRRWEYVSMQVADHQLGAAFQHLVRNDFWPGMIFASLLFVLAIFILAWPGRQSKSAEVKSVEKQKQKNPAQQTV